MVSESTESPPQIVRATRADVNTDVREVTSPPRKMTLDLYNGQSLASKKFRWKRNPSGGWRISVDAASFPDPDARTACFMKAPFPNDLVGAIRMPNSWGDNSSENPYSQDRRSENREKPKTGLHNLED